MLAIKTLLVVALFGGIHVLCRWRAEKRSVSHKLLLVTALFVGLHVFVVGVGGCSVPGKLQGIPGDSPSWRFARVHRWRRAAVLATRHF